MLPFFAMQKILKEMNKLYLLLILVPLALWFEWAHADPLIVFIASALAIIPLAGLMGESTEQLSRHVGAGWGGFLNASFGNAAELIIALMALRQGLHDVVKASITGSILGNILLVLGVAMVAGGLRYERQRFNRTAAGLGSSLLGKFSGSSNRLCEAQLRYCRGPVRDLRVEPHFFAQDTPASVHRRSAAGCR